MRPAARGVWLAAAGLAMTATAGDLRAAAPSQPNAGEEAAFRYDAKGRRDPFAPLVRDGHIVSMSSGMRGDSSKPVLYGVLWDPSGNSIALINDGEARVGDAVGEYHVIEIRKDAVVLSSGGEPVVIELAFDAPPKSAASGSTGGTQP